MIVPITGNVTYDITLDPSVWIFDDRKVLFNDAFNDHQSIKQSDSNSKSDSHTQTYDQKIKPPVNKSITRFERDKILQNTYVMPIKEFISHAEVKSDAKQAKLVTKHGDKIIPLDVLQDCYLLFAVKGKQIKDDGPVHVYFKDGSNKDQPIKAVEKIVIQ